MRKYTPRRAGTRWLNGAPEYVLDCFYHHSSNSYDVLFTGSLLGTVASEPQDFAHVYVMGLDVSANGAWSSFELPAYEAAQYRYRNGKKRVKWAEMPEKVRKSVEIWALVDVTEGV